MPSFVYCAWSRIPGRPRHSATSRTSKAGRSTQVTLSTTMAGDFPSLNRIRISHGGIIHVPSLPQGLPGVCFCADRSAGIRARCQHERNRKISFCIRDLSAALGIADRRLRSWGKRSSSPQAGSAGISSRRRSRGGRHRVAKGGHALRFDRERGRLRWHRGERLRAFGRKPGRRAQRYRADGERAGGGLQQKRRAAAVRYSRAALT